ncbi:MAG: hypothetical protein HY903_00415 [Deltaproteobacteria bacterium]|nr:hypothetical protein [Deltaproteobacteria bacterium]
MVYQGPERRHHRVFVTNNTEYHFRDDVCVAVRDCRKGTWQTRHSAIGAKLMGGIAVTPQGSWKVSFGSVDVGQKLCFGNDILTTPVHSILRPGRDTVESYPIAASA